MKGATFSDHRILDVLASCGTTIDWLKGMGPIAVEQIPQEHFENIKVLENLAIVIKRNNRTLEIASQRLRRVLESESRS